MRRPAIVTGLAYWFLTSVMTMFRAYDAKAAIDKTPLYPGSAFTVVTQWTWHWVQIPLTAMVAVGLFRGWRWARWLALAVFVVASGIAAPLRDARAAPLYVFVSAINLAIYALLFFAPGAKVYFSRSTRPEKGTTLLGGLSTSLLVFAVFTAHCIAFSTMREKPDPAATWGSAAVLLLPALMFSALARWDLQRAAREIAAALLAVTVALIALQVDDFIAIHALSPAVTRQPNWFQSMLLSIVVGLTGLTLAVWTVRARKTATQ